MALCKALAALLLVGAVQGLLPQIGFLAQVAPSNKLLHSTRSDATNATLSARSESDCSVTYGANNFGDIMGGCETHITVGGDTFSALERVVLTANGNLQRIMSAYYGAPVSVRVRHCNRVPRVDGVAGAKGEQSFGVYDREVDLVMGGQVFCTAVGRIELLDQSCVEAIESSEVGLGQLFRYLGALPHFVLLEAGKKGDGVLWRRYSLSCAQLQCEFTETFALGFLDLLPPPA